MIKSPLIYKWEHGEKTSDNGKLFNLADRSMGRANGQNRLYHAGNKAHF